MTKLPETHTKKNPHLKIFATFSHYIEALTSKAFFGYLSPYMLVTGGMIGYYTVTPFIFIVQLKMSAATFGYLSVVTVASYIAGVVFSRFFSAKLGLQRMIIIGEIILCFSVLLITAFAIFSHLGIMQIILPMAVYALGAGMICPNSNAGAMHVLRHKAGAAAAVVGFSLYLSSAVLSSIITAIPLNSLWPLVGYIFAVTFLAILSFVLLVFKKHEEITDHHLVH